MKRFFLNPTLFLALLLMLIISMMILPIHSNLLDLGFALSFSLAILVLIVTLFIERPLDFSAFPTILLTTLMLRLSLNVSSTKLIIGEGHTGTQAAGGVIQGFSQFIMGGSVFMGLIVFLVLLIVNFMVITKGATRMAEVGARFALDGMPGKQLAIDSDLAAGAISHDEAKERRGREQNETTFFGSLDGASKFVKGDAIAGLLITLLNLCAGLAMGVFAHGMTFGTAFETYSTLTVGDGLVSQIPAVIVSVAAALLLARGSESVTTDVAIFEQLGRYPLALYCVSVLTFIFAVLPGLPFLPFAVGSAALAGVGYWSQQNLKKTQSTKRAPDQSAEKREPSMGDLLEIDDLHIEFAPNLVNMMLDPSTGLDARIVNMRRHIATSYGLILPEVRLSDQMALSAGEYIIRVQGVEDARGILEASQVMALLPENSGELDTSSIVTEPVYGAPAKWLDQDEQETAALQGLTIVTPEEILATHVLEVIKRNMARLFNLKTLRRMLREFGNLSDPQRAESNQNLIDELVPDKVPLDVLHAVLKLLLEEQVSIRNLPLILEAISESRLSTSAPEMICERVRQKLGFQLTAPLKREDGTIPLLQLDSAWEATFEKYEVSNANNATDVALPPKDFNVLAENIANELKTSTSNGIFPALVTGTHRRRFVKTVARAKGITVPVLSFEELGTDSKPSLVGTISPSYS